MNQRERDDLILRFELLMSKYKPPSGKIFENEMLKALDQIIETYHGSNAKYVKDRMIAKGVDIVKELRRSIPPSVVKDVRNETQSVYGKIYDSLVDNIVTDMIGVAVSQDKMLFTGLFDDDRIKGFGHIDRAAIDWTLAINRYTEIQGYALEELIANNTAHFMNKVKSILTQSLIHGWGTDDTYRKIKEVTKKQAVHISKSTVNTAMQTARDISRDKEFRALEKNVGVEYYLYSACMCSTTCLVCASLDDRKFYKKIDDIPPTQKPRIHFNCRCQLLPVLDGSLETIRKSRENFKQWFARQEEDFKKKYLGAARYELYKQGASLDQFADWERGRELSLKEIEQFMKMRTTATIEATPGKDRDTDTYNKLLNSTPEERLDYENKHIGMVEQLMKKYDLTGEIEISKGAYDGQTNPNIQIYFKTTPDREGGILETDQINAMLSEFGQATDQDSVGWYTTQYKKGEENAILFNITDSLTKEEFDTFYLKLIEANSGLGINEKKDRIEIRDYTESLSMEELEDIIDGVLDSTGGLNGKFVDGSNTTFTAGGGAFIENGDYDQFIDKVGGKYTLTYILPEPPYDRVEYDASNVVEQIRKTFDVNYENRDWIRSVREGREITIELDYKVMTSGSGIDLKIIDGIKDKDTFEAIVHSTGVEHLMVWDKDGNRIDFNKGDDQSVNFSPLINLDLLPGSTLSHNHPLGIHPLSYGDLQTFSMNNLYELRAVSGDWVYSIKDELGVFKDDSMVYDFNTAVRNGWDSWMEAEMRLTNNGEWINFNTDYYQEKKYTLIKKIAEGYPFRLKYTRERFYR